jgi:glycogen debranching enzyme
MEPEILEQDGRKFVSAEYWSFPEYYSVPGSQPVPKLTLKADELFLIADTLGNITDGMEDDQTLNLGLFCHDTRFLSCLELQIEERNSEGKTLKKLAPILLSSSADRGFALSVLCANPRLADINPETIGIQREIVINSGLFEEIEVTNYNTKAVNFTLTLNIEADFADLFEIRGQKRPQRGIHLREIPQDLDPYALTPLTQYQTDTLTLAYRGLDGALMESRVQFYQHPPSYFQGYTAVWQLSLEPHATEKIGYRLQAIVDGKRVNEKRCGEGESG